MPEKLVALALGLILCSGCDQRALPDARSRSSSQAKPPVVAVGEKARLRALREMEGDRFLAGVIGRVEGLVRAGDFDEAIRALTEAEESKQLFGASKKRFFLFQGRIERQARSASPDVVSPVVNADREAATNKAAHPDAPTSKPARVADPGESLRLLAEVEGFVARRQYRKALPGLGALLSLATPEQKRLLERRRARLERIADLMEALIADIGNRRSAYRKIDLGSSLVGRVEQADLEKVVFRLEGVARATWSWARLDVDRLHAVFSRAALEAEQQMALGELFLISRSPEHCLQVLARAFPHAGSSRGPIEEVVAEARGFAAVPEGGFQLVGDQFLTTLEKKEHDLKIEIASLARVVEDAEPGAWKSPAGILGGHGERGRAALRTALGKRLEVTHARLRTHGPLASRSLAATRSKLAAELEKGRAAALALIRDGKRYPYPYGPEQKTVQAEVDRLVGVVEAVWKRPARLLIQRDSRLNGLVADAHLVEAALAESGGGEAVKLTVDGILTDLDRRLAMSEYAGDGRGKSLLDHWKSVREHNAALTEVIRADERELHRLTNEYRVMMGLRAVMIDDRLVRCARGHSQEMKDLGYFAHQSPVPGRQSPSMRAKLAGWGGSVSENIAQGNKAPARVLRQWLGSSGHHRNILGRGHTHLGVGGSKDATYWTQNFGRGSSRPAPRKK